MEIIENTTTKLLLRYRPIQSWIAAGGFILVVPALFLLIGRSLPWLYYIQGFRFLPIFPIIFGCILLSLSPKIIFYEFNKTLEKFIFKQRGLFKTKIIEHSLRDILTIQLESTSWNSDENGSYQIVLVFRNGKTIPLNLTQVSSNIKKQAILDMIFNFLGLPPKQLIMDNG